MVSYVLNIEGKRERERVQAIIVGHEMRPRQISSRFGDKFSVRIEE